MKTTQEVEDFDRRWGPVARGMPADGAAQAVIESWRSKSAMPRAVLRAWRVRAEARAQQLEASTGD
eukprot:10142032-Alexandrium_andersonii.AAC.1